MATNFQGLRCWYCGDTATTQDHVVARKSGLPRKARKRLRKTVMGQFNRNTLPACDRCNSAKGDRTLEQFRADVASAVLPVFEVNRRARRLVAIREAIAPFKAQFYGERGTADAVFPPVNQAQPFRYRVRIPRERNEGPLEARIEECAKMGKGAEILAGLMNGK